MEPITASALLIEVIAGAIGGSGDVGARFGLKKLKNLIQQEKIRTGSSAFNELDKMLQIAYYQSLVLIIDDSIKLIKTVTQNKISRQELTVYDIDFIHSLDQQKLTSELETLLQLKADAQKHLQRLKPPPVVKHVKELIVSKFTKKSNVSLDIDSDILTELDMSILFVDTDYQTSDETDKQSSQIFKQIFPFKIDPDLTATKIIHALAFKKSRFAYYGWSFFAYQLKNNPSLINIIQTQYLYSIRSDLKKLKNLIESKENSSNLNGITKYLENIYKTYQDKSIHDYDVFALPITLKPGNFKFIGEASLHHIPDRCIVIHGKPACGKTTLIRRIVASTTPDSYFIPIEIPLSENIDFVNLREIIKRSLRLKDNETFEHVEEMGRLLIMFDALNEVHDIYRTSLNLSFITSQFDKSHFLITSRTHELHNEANLSGFKYYEIQPLSYDNQIQVIETHTTNTETRDKLLSIFAENKFLRNICSNQLIFLMSTRLLEKNRIDSNQISEFYTKFIRWSLIDWEKRDGIERIKTVLENLAYKIVRSTFSKTYIDKTDIDSLWTDEPKVCTQSEFKFLLKSGFVENTPNGYRIFQETFQEYLLASWLVSHGIFPCDLNENPPGKWFYKNEFELSDLLLRFYVEMTGILEFRSFVSTKSPLIE